MKQLSEAISKAVAEKATAKVITEADAKAVGEEAAAETDLLRILYNPSEGVARRKDSFLRGRKSLRNIKKNKSKKKSSYHYYSNGKQATLAYIKPKEWTEQRVVKVSLKRLPQNVLNDTGGKLKDLQPIDYSWHHEVGLAGLVNIGNSCYINAVLQCLLNTPVLNNFLRDSCHSKTCKVNRCLICALTDTMVKLCQSELPVIPFKVIDHVIQDSSLNPCEQEDAGEFLFHFIDCLEDISFGINNDSNISDVTFVGQEKQVTTCCVCNNVSVTKPTNFLCLHLPIASRLRNKRIGNKIKKYFSPSSLNSYHCLNCKNRVDAKRQTFVTKAPNCLVLQLLRFSNTNGNITKIDALVEAEEEVKLPTDNEGDVTYELYAVIAHEGGYGSGHYFTYLKTRENRDWWLELNDENTLVSEPVDVLFSTKGYLYFYKKKIDFKDTKAVSCDGNDDTTSAVRTVHAVDSEIQNEPFLSSQSGEVECEPLPLRRSTRIKKKQEVLI